MINFMIPHYMGALKVIHQEISLCVAKIHSSGDAVLDGVDKDRIRQNFKYVLKKADDYGLETVQNRIERITILMNPNRVVTLSETIRQMQALIEAFEDDTKYLYLYAYPKEKAKRFIRYRADWAPALSSFPSIEKDGEAANDLYALGHNEACVFHSMQVLEKGLAALAANVGETFDVQQWEGIIGAIEGKIKGIQKNGIPGMATQQKNERLQFLSEAAKEFRYFKDGWRNYVSHGRGDYDEDQAKSVLEHVRTFMNHLASQLPQGHDFS